MLKAVKCGGCTRSWWPGHHFEQDFALPQVSFIVSGLCVKVDLMFA